MAGTKECVGRWAAAEQAGWETLHIEREEDVEMPPVEAVMLPWPKSFREDKLVSAQGTLTRESVLALDSAMPRGAGGRRRGGRRAPHAAQIVRPEQNEAFLRKMRG